MTNSRKSSNETLLGWNDYSESEDFKTKKGFDDSLRNSTNADLILSTPDLSVYTTKLYPQSAYLVIIGGLDKGIDCIPKNLNKKFFIKTSLKNLTYKKLTKVFDTYQITYRKAPKAENSLAKPLEISADFNEVIDLYLLNHTHHETISRSCLQDELKKFNLLEVSGEGFKIFAEDLGNAYETSYFTTDRTLVGRHALLEKLLSLGSFNMELDSTNPDFEYLAKELGEYMSYECSLFLIQP